MHSDGLEPPTYSLEGNCPTNWANFAVNLPRRAQPVVRYHFVIPNPTRLNAFRLAVYCAVIREYSCGFYPAFSPL